MKPKFDPSKPYEAVASGKPKFDPAQPYEAAAPIKDYNSPEALAAEGEATKMAELRYDHGGKGEAMLRGGAQGLTAGTSDEIVGGAQAIWDDMKAAFTGKDANNGVTPQRNQFGEVTNGQELTGDYNKYRDEQRNINKVSHQAHPAIYNTSEIGAGVASSFIPGLGALNAGKGAKLAEVTGKAALQGGLAGFGYSEEDNAAGILEDTAKGAAIGGATGGLIHGAGKIPGVTREAIQKGKQGLSVVDDVTKAMGEGAKDRGIVGAVTGPAAAIKKVIEMGGDAVGEAKIANEFKRTLGPGHFRDMSNPEIISQLVDEGNDQAIHYAATRIHQLTGAPVDETITLLKAGPMRRIEARTFDYNKAGGDIVGDVENMSNALSQGTKARRAELEDIARQSYKGDTQAVLDGIEKQFFSAGELSSTKGAQSVLSDVHAIIGGGKNAEDLGLKPGNWMQHDGAEQFNRLQKARQLLDDNIDWEAIAPKNGKPSRSPSHVEKKLMQVRREVDEALKGASDAKVESDGMYGQYKELEKRLLNKTMKEGEFDKYTVGNMLKDNQNSMRFRDNLDLLNEFANRPGLDPKVKATVEAFRDKFGKHLDTANLKRTLQKLEAETVGSSRSGRAAQAAESLKRGDNPLQELFKAPDQALRVREGVVSRAEKFFGKPFAEMSIAEKNMITKYQTLVKQNPDLDFVESARKWMDLKK